MRVLIVTPLYYKFHCGGLAYSSRRIGQGLAKNGNEVTVVNIDSENQYWDEANSLKGFFQTHDEDVDLIHLPQDYSYTGVELPKKNEIATKMNQWYLFLREWVEKNKPDVMISFFIVPYGYPLALVSQEFKIPLISAIRGNDIGRFIHDPLMVPLIKHTLDNSKINVVLAKDLQTQVKLMSPKAKTEVIYNSSDPKIFDRKWTQVANREKIVIGSTGVFKPKKGIEVLVRAFEKKKWKNVEMLLVGDFVKNTTKKEGLVKNAKNKITITGIVPRESVLDYLDKMDIYVTLTYSDGCPNAVLEAMAAGRCIITTRVASMADILEDKKSAIFVDSMDEDEILKKIVWLVDNPEEIKRVGVNAKKASKKLLPPYEINEWNRLLKKM